MYVYIYIYIWDYIYTCIYICDITIKPGPNSVLHITHPPGAVDSDGSPPEGQWELGAQDPGAMVNFGHFGWVFVGFLHIFL